MTNIAFSLDWLRFTLPYEFVENDTGAPVFIGSETEECRPILSYNMAVENEHHKICWHTEHPEFRVLVEMTGQQLSLAREAGSTDSGILSGAIRHGARFTRVDFAIDMMDTGGEVSEFAKKWQTAGLQTKARTMTHIDGQNKTGSTGETVYLGARQSTRMIRVYHKGKQTGTALDWLRIELEWKKERAQQMAAQMSKGKVKDAGLSHLRDFVTETDIDWFEEIFSGNYTEFEIEAIGRPQTDHQRWLYEVCIPAIADAAKKRIPGILEAVEAILLEAQDNDNKHGPKLTPRP